MRRRREKTPTSRATQPKWLRPRTFSKFLDENYSVKPRFSATQQSVVCTESECGQIEWSWSGSTFRAFSGPPLRALLRFLRRNLSSKSGKLELAAQAAARQRLASRGQLGGYSRPFGFFGLGPRAQRAAGWKVFCYGFAQLHVQAAVQFCELCSELRNEPRSASLNFSPYVN